MTQYYPMQVITLDEASHRALDLLGESRFDHTIKIEPKKLSTTMIGEYHQIIVLSTLTEEIALELLSELSHAEEPIIILPDSVQDSEEMKQLLRRSIRIVLSPSDTLISVSLSHTLEMMESLFYGNETETEIAVDHKDIYEVIGKGTVSEFHMSTGTNISTATMKIFNTPKGFNDVSGAYVLYELHEDWPMMEIVAAMEIVEAKLPEDSGILFATRNSADQKNVKITCVLSRYFDFKYAIQQEINESETYLRKVSVIVDAYAFETITGEEADTLGERNSLDSRDLKAIYDLVYEQPMEIITLIQMMQDKNISESRKVEAVVDVVINESIEVNVAEAIAEMQKLSIDEIISMINLKRAGKLPLQDIVMDRGLSDKYPKLTLTKSVDTPVLIYKDEIEKESDGMLTIESDELTLYEKDGVEWFVSKKLGQEEVDSFVEEYGQLFELS